MRSYTESYLMEPSVVPAAKHARLEQKHIINNNQHSDKMLVLAPRTENCDILAIRHLCLYSIS